MALMRIKRKAGLRLDIEEIAFAELKENPGKHAIVARKPGQSVLYQRINSDDPKEIMPPEDANLTLTQYEKRLIKKWIEQGGKYEKHWAFIPPQKSLSPKINKKHWVQNEIDAFVLGAIGGKEPKPLKKS